MVIIRIIIYVVILIALIVLFFRAIKKKSKILAIFVGIFFVLFVSILIEPNIKNTEKTNAIEKSMQGAIEQFERSRENNVNEKNTYEGLEILGIIEVPSINIKYPIFETSTEAPVSLLYGSLNKVGNAVIYGWNHMDGMVFNNLKNVTKNDSIFITDSSGTKIEYIVYDIYEIDINESAISSGKDKNKVVTLYTVKDKEPRKVIIKASEKRE